jgi:PAS domain S-box-containing protein
MTDLGAAAKLRAAFELSPTILAVSGLESGRFIEVNDAFVRTFGYAREDIVGRSIDELNLWVEPEVRRRGLAGMRVGQPVRDMEARFRTKSGGEVVAIANADLVEVDGQVCVLTALIDITARVRAVRALRESEERFAQAFNANPLPMTITSVPEGRHLAVNDAAVRHGGYAREEMLGRTTVELGMWSAPEEREQLMEALRMHGSARDFEMVFRTKSWDLRHLLVSCQIITYGGAPAVLTVALDITERKQFETLQEARRAEAETVARAKDEFLAMLGHELRNPLATITNALAVLDRMAGGDELRRFTGIIRRQTGHLSRLVDDLLDIARLTSGKIELRLETVDLRDVAIRSLDALREAGRTAQHDVSIEGESVRVEGDPARLEQVTTNLLDNALKYTPPGGRIRVFTGQANADAVLRVRDTGVGIAPNLLPLVFDLFVQEPQALDRARGGLGLGLTLVKRLVELHGGSVGVASDGPGLGTEFTIRVPLAGQAASQDGGGGQDSAATAGRRRVAIVEDNPDARESLSLLLELAGHHVEQFEDASAALANLANLRLDVALIDLGLPGMDGYELARAIRRMPATRGLFLVALTGYGQSEARQKALDSGFDVHLTKPVDPQTLESLLAGLPTPR